MLRLNYLKIFTAVAVLLSTFVGTNIFGISLNKICLIPLYVYLICTSTISAHNMRINRRNYPLLMYMFAAISCLYALTFNFENRYSGYDSTLILYFIQCVIIYIPILFLVYNHNRKDDIKKYLIEAILISAKIQAAFALLQLIFWYSSNIDIGTVLSEGLSSILSFEEGRSWTCVYWDESGLAIRPSGFNIDPNFLTITLLLGIALEKKVLFKIIYVALILLSGTRSGLIVLGVLGCYQLYMVLKRNKRIKKRVFIILSVIVIVFLAIFSYLYNFNPAFSTSIDTQLSLMISRFNIENLISNPSLSTLRHISYYPIGIDTYFWDLNLFQKIIGTGPRVSGVIIQNNELYAKILSLNYNYAWSLECDVIELLLGYGGAGFALYYFNIFKMIRNDKTFVPLFLVILFDGLMYGVSSLTITNLIFIIFSTTQPIKEKIRSRKVFKMRNNK